MYEGRLVLRSAFPCAIFLNVFIISLTGLNIRCCKKAIMITLLIIPKIKRIILIDKYLLIIPLKLEIIS